MGTIDIRDSGGWTIENLELSNQSAVRSERMGIFVTATDSGTHKNFIVRNCFIHDVTGEFKNFNNGGIIFRVTGESVPTKFDGVLIENNEIRNISPALASGPSQPGSPALKIRAASTGISLADTPISVLSFVVTASVMSPAMPLSLAARTVHCLSTTSWVRISPPKPPAIRCIPMQPTTPWSVQRGLRQPWPGRGH